MSEAALRFEDVTAGYGPHPVVVGVDLEVFAGQVVGLIGPNGSGKTTLVRVASRALAPIAGRVRVCGVDPYAIAAREAAKLVAVVPQDLVPAFQFTAHQVALMGRAPHQRAWWLGSTEDWSVVRRAMDATGVSDLAERAMDTLSGGERRRVVLAQALAQEAPVLLLDEPTTHLDLHHVVELLELVRTLSRAGRAVLAVFHDLNLAASACDRIAALSDGRVIADGRPEDVVTAPIVEAVYGVRAEVVANPVTGAPLVLTPGSAAATASAAPARWVAPPPGR